VSRRDDDLGHQEVQPLRLGRWIVVGLVVVVVLVFVGQNREDATVQFLWMEGQLSLWVVALAAAALGAVVGLVAGRRRRR
jgi:uncharacterized integral membrane protein